MKKSPLPTYKSWLYVIGSFVIGLIVAVLVVQYFKEPIVRFIVSQ